MVEHPKNNMPNQPNNIQNGEEGQSEEMEVEVDYETEENEDFDNNETFPETEELADIDHQLDALNAALDTIEQKNDNILSELTVLLNENREIRKQLQQVRLENEVEDSKKPQQ